MKGLAQIAGLAGLIILCQSVVRGQDTTRVQRGAADSLRATAAESLSVPQEAVSPKEIILKPLYVERRPEAPSVSFFPKPVEPKLEEVEFISRSFMREIRKGPDRLYYLEQERRRVEKIDRAKKMLAKKRK